MSERLQEPATEEVLPELPAVTDESQPLDAPPAEAAPQDLHLAEKTISWLRLAYCFEFLLAVLAIFTLWSEVGGQGHLDLMPWYTKLICVLASAWCSIRLTAGLVEERTAWNRRTVAWLAGLILVAFMMSAITYYYHLHEETDQPDSDENTATATTPNAPRTMRSFAE